MTASDAKGVLARPGDAIGILGGGQLGRMLALAAADLGLDVHVFTPEQESPASRVAKKTWVAPFDDKDALREFAASVKVATIEFENIPPGRRRPDRGRGHAGAPERPPACDARRTGWRRRRSSGK